MTYVTGLHRLQSDWLILHVDALGVGGAHSDGE